MKTTIVKTLALMAVFIFLYTAVATRTGLAFDVNNPNGSTDSACSSTASKTNAPQSDYCNDTEKNTGKNGIYGKGGLILEVADLVAYAGGIAAVIMIIIGGLRLILSGGNPNQISEAKNMIIYALVGIVVIVMAQFLVRFVLGDL